MPATTSALRPVCCLAGCYRTERNGAVNSYVRSCNSKWFLSSLDSGARA